MENQPAVIADARYRRARIKKQFTFRLDEELAAQVVRVAESHGLRLSEAIEIGLGVWLLSMGENLPDIPISGSLPPGSAPTE